MRYVLAGTGFRALHMFAEPILEELSECAEIVGVFDINPLRMEALKRRVGLKCPSYRDFDVMMAETRPDRVIVATIDGVHHEYIVRAMEAGADVITEKPMTIDAEKCRAILEAEERTGRHVYVTFNLRFVPYNVEIKRLIEAGAVGDVLSVDFEYMVADWHGAEYLRRWHGNKRNSGGLLVHKSTHHFDLVNWWLDDDPVDVMAYGDRRFFRSDPERRGRRCLTCDNRNTCKFYFDVDSDDLVRELYHECEAADGYLRDRCVFSDEIDIEDNMSVNVRYEMGGVLTYSLIVFCPFGGYKASINGNNGRLELAYYISGVPSITDCHYIDHYDFRGFKTTHTMPIDRTSHGGGDYRLREMLFRENIPDPLGQRADSYAGARSLLIGAAANKSIAEKRNVSIAELDWRPNVAASGQAELSLVR